MATTWAINSYLKHYLTIPSFSKAECKNKTKQKINFRKAHIQVVLLLLLLKLCFSVFVVALL